MVMPRDLYSAVLWGSENSHNRQLVLKHITTISMCSAQWLQNNGLYHTIPGKAAHRTQHGSTSRAVQWAVLIVSI